MDKALIALAEQGEPSLLILSTPAEFAASGLSSDCLALPILSRQGGILLCVPRGVISEDLLIDSLQGTDDDAFLGPSKGVEAHLIEEDDNGQLVQLAQKVNCLVVDFSDAVLAFLRDYEQPESAADDPLPFVTAHPSAIPIAAEIVLASRAWLSSQNIARVNFYSALEELEAVEVPVEEESAKNVATKKGPPAKRVTNAQVMDQLTAVLAQLQDTRTTKKPDS